MDVSKTGERINPWVMAIRPRTLPAALGPVIVGSAATGPHGGIKIVPALAALAGALLLQIGVNLANDYFDYKKGVDTRDRLGPVRVTQSGLISPYRVRRAMGVFFGFAVLIGIYLIRIGGWPILAIGTAAILSALAYSGGPYPLGSHGLGDLFVFLFFGPAAVFGTFYVQALAFSTLALWAAVPVGLLITAILVVNNLRDIGTDQRAGKRTLAVILGKKGARVEYAFLLAAAYLAPIAMVWTGCVPVLALLPILSLPMAVSLTRRIFREEGTEMNRTLAGTARLSLLFSLLFSPGLILS